MYYLIAILSLVVIWVILSWNDVACAAEAKVAKFKVGKASVWAIADSTNDRDMSVFPDVEPQLISQYVPSGKAPCAIMVFLVKIENELILIDAGVGAQSGDRISRLHDGLRQIGVTPEQITLILLTHMNIDHIGGLMWDDKKAFPLARVLSVKAEYDFWLDKKSLELYPNRKPNFELVQKIFEHYSSNSETFEFGAMVAPGIRSIDARGHTPGQSAFLLESDGEKLLFWADIIHAAELQFPRPEINAHFDINPEEAAAARVRFMDMAAEAKLLVAGSHHPFPGIGTVEKSASSGYVYTSR